MYGGSILALARLARTRPLAIATLAFLPRLSATPDNGQTKAQCNVRDVYRTKTMFQAGEQEDCQYMIAMSGPCVG
jgi:hypothetical protein